MRFCLALLLLLTLLPSHFAIASSDKKNSVTLDEAFVEIRVTKIRGSSFYRVLVDEKERPYLNVNDVFQNWFDMKVDCEIDRQFCQAVMQPSGTVFWLDLKQMQFGGSLNKGQHFSSKLAVVEEGKIWLRYDLWEDWLPMTAIWDLSRYTLAFQPHFPLLSDLKHSREMNRIHQNENKRQNQINSSLEQRIAGNKGRTESRYSVQSEYGSEGDSAIQADFDLVSDLNDGTLLLGASATDNRIDEPEQEFNFWQYRKLRQANYHLLNIGQTNSNSTILLPNLSMENAIQLDRLERISSPGTFEFQDRTQPDTEIDVYRNGFLQTTIVSDKSGLYRIEKQLVAGGDRIVLKYYFTDGSEDSEVITIASDNALLLESGQWDGQLLTGELPEGWFTQVGMRYGIAEKFTLGTHVVSTHKENDTRTGILMDMVWRPRSWLNLMTESLFDKSGSDYGFQANMTGIDNNLFQIESRIMSQQSMTLNLPVTERSFKETILRHQFRSTRWSIQDKVTYTGSRTDLDVIIDHAVNRTLSLQISAQQPLQGGAEKNTQFRALFAVTNNSRLEVSNVWGADSLGTTNAEYTLQGGDDLPVDANIRISRSSTDNSIDTSASISWRILPGLKLDLFRSPEQYGLSISWSNIIASNPGPDRWDVFAKGTLSGQIMQPSVASGQKATPLAGAVIRADSIVTTSDNEGEFVITGLPTHKRIAVSVDRNSIDATLAPKENTRVMYFRPASHISYQPELIWTSGLDGVLLRDGIIPVDAMILVSETESGTYVTQVPPEQDGFFIIEGLTPGRYTLSLAGVELPPQSLQIELLDGMDWLPGLEWKWQ